MNLIDLSYFDVRNVVVIVGSRDSSIKYNSNK